LEKVEPYLGKRQRGTVREDYGQDGNTWGYFAHNQVAVARPATGVKTVLRGPVVKNSCYVSALALWSGMDPILKDRLLD
jgi:hypothetical protein